LPELGCTSTHAKFFQPSKRDVFLNRLDLDVVAKRFAETLRDFVEICEIGICFVGRLVTVAPGFFFSPADGWIATSLDVTALDNFERSSAPSSYRRYRMSSMFD